MIMFRMRFWGVRNITGVTFVPLSGSFQETHCVADYELFTLICIMFSPGRADGFHPAGQLQPRVTTAQSGALPIPRGEGRGLPAPQPRASPEQWHQPEGALLPGLIPSPQDTRGSQLGNSCLPFTLLTPGSQRQTPPRVGRRRVGSMTGLCT